MAEAHELSLAFIESHPGDAARVLEQLSAEDAATFIGAVPARLGTPVFRHMLYTKAAQCLSFLDDDAASRLIQGIGPQAGAAVLRSLSPARRTSILEQLPSMSALAFRMVLGYPTDAVGAWMDTTVPVFVSETPAEEALAQLRSEEYPATFTYCVYAVDAEQRFAGIVPLQDLIRAEGGTRLSMIMRPPAHSLQARTSLASVRSHPGWDDFPSLPVVERQNRFAGALHHAALATALTQSRPEIAPDSSGEIGAFLTSTFWTVFAGLLQSAVTLLPVRPKQLQEVEKHEG